MVHNRRLNVGDKVIRNNISEEDKQLGLSEGTIISIDGNIATVELRFPWQDNPQNIEQPSKSSIYKEYVNNLKVIDEFQYLVLHISMNGRVRVMQNILQNNWFSWGYKKWLNLFIMEQLIVLC